MPPTYRHPHLWFLDNSQQFKSTDEMMTDFKGWGSHFKDSTTGYQFGYEADRFWWSKLKAPPRNSDAASARKSPTIVICSGSTSRRTR